MWQAKPFDRSKLTIGMQSNLIALCRRGKPEGWMRNAILLGIYGGGKNIAKDERKHPILSNRRPTSRWPGSTSWVNSI